MPTASAPPTPRTPEQYRLSLFDPDDLPKFAPYEQIAARSTYYTQQAHKFEQRLGGLKNIAIQAQQAFQRSLSDEDYAAMIVAVAAYNNEKSVFDSQPAFGSSLITAFAPAALATEFPNAAADLAGIMDFMVNRLTDEANRIRPTEEKRLADSDAALTAFGHTDEAPASVDERSPVLKDLLRAVANMQRIKAQLLSGDASFRSVGQFAAPIIKALRG